MSDKKQKKQEKKEVKEFKAAFKKTTGVASDSTDTAKLLEAFQIQLNELKKWSAILVKLQPDQRDTATQRLLTWNQNVTDGQTLAKTDKKAAAVQIRNQIALLLSVNEVVRKQAKRKPVSKTVGDHDVSVFITDIPGFDKLDPGQREQALTVAANKIGNGLSIYEKIKDGSIDLDDPNLKVRPDEVESLIWAMKSKAQEKNKGPYQKGAMTVPNGEKLRKFFDKCPEVYSRLSSHLREEQGRNEKGGVTPKDLTGQTPRGMDFYNMVGDDKPGQLPAGMNTLLYQQVLLPGGEKAMYIKMESEGSFGHSKDMFFMKGALDNRAIDSTVPPDRPPHENDPARARKHLKNLLIKAKGDDKDLPGLREQTPKELTVAIKTVVSAVEGKKAKAYLKSSYGTEPKKILFKQLVPRIATFIDAYDKAQSHGGEAGWDIGDKAVDLYDKFDDLLFKLFPNDYLESGRRLGGEVVVSEDDFEQPQQDDYDGDQEVSDFEDEYESEDEDQLERV